jgi:hypothetical protein
MSASAKAWGCNSTSKHPVPDGDRYIPSEEEEKIIRERLNKIEEESRRSSPAREALNELRRKPKPVASH